MPTCWQLRKKANINLTTFSRRGCFRMQNIHYPLVTWGVPCSIDCHSIVIKYCPLFAPNISFDSSSTCKENWTFYRVWIKMWNIQLVCITELTLWDDVLPNHNVLAHFLYLRITFENKCQHFEIWVWSSAINFMVIWVRLKLLSSEESWKSHPKPYL